MLLVVMEGDVSRMAGKKKNYVYNALCKICIYICRVGLFCGYVGLF